MNASERLSRVPKCDLQSIRSGLTAQESYRRFHVPIDAFYFWKFYVREFYVRELADSDCSQDRRCELDRSLNGSCCPSCCSSGYGSSMRGGEKECLWSSEYPDMSWLRIMCENMIDVTRNNDRQSITFLSHPFILMLRLLCHFAILTRS